MNHIFESVAIASDHRGYKLKQEIKKYIVNQLNVDVNDCGPFDEITSVDYPDYVKKVVESMFNSRKKTFGVLICYSGIGMSIAANRYQNIRAVLCNDIETSKLSRIHNNANIICFGSHFIDVKTANKCIKIFVDTEFDYGRHLLRIKKIDTLAKLQ